MKSKEHTSRRNLNPYNNFMNSNSTAKIEVVYVDKIELLDESEHQNSQDLARKLNEVIVALNKSK